MIMAVFSGQLYKYLAIFLFLACLELVVYVLIWEYENWTKLTCSCWQFCYSWKTWIMTNKKMYFVRLNDILFPFIKSCLIHIKGKTFLKKLYFRKRWENHKYVSLNVARHLYQRKSLLVVYRNRKQNWIPIEFAILSILRTSGEVRIVYQV